MGEARTTKEEIVQLLKVKGEQTVAMLAESLQITEMAVRRHLSKLEKEQVIHSKMMRQHVGRPIYVYGLSEKGEDLFPKEYKQFALDILEELQRIGDETIVKAILQARTERMEEQLQKRVSRQDKLINKLKEVAFLQERNGYMVQVKQEGENSFILQKQNCPLMTVAEKFPQLCVDEKNMYQRLFSSANVKVLSNMCDGDCHCSYQIQEKK
ncbi:DeoR family transcriptional regulator [Bacillus sp. DX1.1]|uniref:helix-turn-helix transcriptional regulator n=1 Tax=unclassified Bacillus (in: firmicutes) TaxID=185979 RepID=UPI00256FC1DA|nr:MULTISPECIES: DeoR family transcriptional regulator [unclassified Bacillus (in: firmicutes)]MDM5157085.1 DeoR family transcriptional regulator [Bacillus sp. DX1.1]WJE81321.1 DeoR family transcriptional regulator [Bacillus sp. DX3.1]